MKTNLSLAGKMMMALAITLEFGATAHAILIVSPNGQAAVEGNYVNSFPFDTGGSLSASPSMRYQQVYASFDFSALNGPSLITQIAFRPAIALGAAFSTTLPNIQLDLSTTNAAPDTLSHTFANNIGANDTIVFSGPLTLSSAFAGPVNGPKAFDIVINLTTPFLYNPAAGNLLLDVRNIGGGTSTYFDAQNTIGDAVSRVFTLQSGVNSPTDDGSADATGGLITRFTASPVPEPGTWVMGVALLVAAAAPLLRRKCSL